jgi:plasmid replication initiation protein
MKNNLIVKKNEFLKFGYSLPMTEQRLLLACISQVDSRTVLDDDHKFVVRVQEMRDLFSDESKNLYRDLKSACETLWDREIVRVDVDGIEKIRWVRKVKYFTNESKIELTFSQDVIPYLTAITERFTKYRLDDVRHFRCVYSLRLYELFAQYQVAGKIEIDVDELRRLFDLEDKYPEFKELKRSVVDKAVSEINKLSNLSVRYGLRKSYRKVVAFQFEFETKQKLVADEKKSLTIDEYVRLNPSKTKGKSELEVRKLMKQSNG